MYDNEEKKNNHCRQDARWREVSGDVERRGSGPESPCGCRWSMGCVLWERGGVCVYMCVCVHATEKQKKEKKK